MPINTTFDPANINEYEKSKLVKNAKGIAGAAAPGVSTNFDLTVVDDDLVATGSLIVIGAAQGDTVDFQIVHPLAGVQIQPITDWYIDPSMSFQKVPSSWYPAKVPAGLILRVIYHSVGVNPVWVAINFDKEKVLG